MPQAAFMIAVSLGIMMAMPSAVDAENPRPADLRGAGITQRLGEQVPLDLPFRDETGRPVQLRDLFDGKPVILVLAYYRCPKLCNQVLNGLVDGLKDVSDLRIGDQLTVLTVSFDSKEDPELAAAKKKTYLDQYGGSDAASGWHFLTGKEESIQPLADAVGFRFAWDAERMQYIHASGIMILTPQGKVARYLFGIRYDPRDLRFSLIEASGNKIGSPVDQALLLFCYSYDPVTGTYKVMALNLVRLGGVVMVVVLVTCLLVAWRRERRRQLSFSREPSASALSAHSPEARGETESV
jgi:protein SCO1/2